MNFTNYLNSSGKEIDREIKDIFSNLNKDIGFSTNKLNALSRLFFDHTKGGKKIRGILIKFGFQLAANSINPEILKIGAAFEILHTSLLIHDDIIDKSDLRRGKKCIYKTLGGNHYGISQAICLGDLGFFLAIDSISQSGFDSDLKNSAIAFLTQTMINTAAGQMLDIEFSNKQSARNEKDVLLIHKLKTASYSFIAPLSIGFILGGGNIGMLSVIKEFGEKLGIAFQIQDDILGSFGNEKDIGKPTYSDIEEGKNTLLITYAAKNASSAQRKVLDKYYGRGKISKQAFEQLLSVFTTTESLQYSIGMAEKYALNAKDIIPTLSNNPEMQEFLKQLTDLAVSRKK